MTTHAFTFGRHPSAPIWTWRCSCGERLRAAMFGAHLSFLPIEEAAERIEIHLADVGAEVVRELLDDRGDTAASLDSEDECDQFDEPRPLPRRHRGTGDPQTSTPGAGPLAAAETS